MLAQSHSNNLSPSPDFRVLFDEAVRNLVAIIETKHTLEPQELASRLIERAIGCSRDGSTPENPGTGYANSTVSLMRVSRCVTVVRGLGLSEAEITPLLESAANSASIERFSTTALRSSLEDLLAGQDESLRAKSSHVTPLALASYRRNLILDWLPAVSVLSKSQLDPDAFLTLFGAYMRGFQHVPAVAASNPIEEARLGSPYFRARVSCAENACDFKTTWRTVPFGCTPPDTSSTFSMQDRAGLYKEIRTLFKTEDDPVKITRICRALASPLFAEGGGLKPLLQGPFTEHERRLLMLTWASLFERERGLIALPDFSLSDSKALKAAEAAVETLIATVTEKTKAALHKGMTAPDEVCRHTRLAHRVVAELCGVDLAQRSEWGSIFLSSKCFAQFTVEAPDRILDLVQAVRNRSEDELRTLILECDEALYRDALHTHSAQLLLALLPHTTRHRQELQVLMSTLRVYQMETCGEIRIEPGSGTYNLGLFELDNGSPPRVTVRDEFLFAWKFDPRFVDRVSKLWREWYGVGADGEHNHQGRASARGELVTFVQRYLAEHQQYYDTYRYLQGAKTKNLSFMFDDSPFPKGPEREEVYRETFQVMRRNFDLSLKLFTFLDYECKRVPGHAESLLGRFMRQSFAHHAPASDIINRSFPGNGWRVAGLRLSDFGLSPDTLQKLFGSQASALSQLSNLNVLMTQGVVAVWCPTCIDTHLDGVPHVWVVFNRHYHPSGNCVGGLVPLSSFGRVLSYLEGGGEFTNARAMMDQLGPGYKDLCWMGNLSGTLSNAYAFDTGPFRGERHIAEGGVAGQEPGGHVHKHYLLQKSLTGTGLEFQMGLQRFQDAHHDIYRAYGALHLLLNAGVLYPFSLFKKGFSVNSLRPEDHDSLARLDIQDIPGVSPYHLLMMLYAEDVHSAARRGQIRSEEATVITYADPLMINLNTPKIALDCATLQVGTWDASGWREIDTLTEYDWPHRGEMFMRYFGDAFRSNSLDLKSINRRWIGL